MIKDRVLPAAAVLLVVVALTIISWWFGVTEEVLLGMILYIAIVRGM